MPKIHQLSPHLADLIAAGEVVERPGSVIKELVENSIDSGASSITVEIKDGGMTYMRVSDNGCGIAPEDVVTAFQRHATSKIADESGLEAIGTLGFRGEALPSIASVSRVDMLTRERGSRAGTEIRLEGGVVIRNAPAGCPEGTSIAVRDLFYNTPARLKFMKSDRAESANVSSAVLRCALSDPRLGLRYLRDGTEELHTPGDGRTDSCIYTLLGRDFFSGLLEAQSQTEEFSVSGYVSTPERARGNRLSQFFFLNGRAIKSATLQAALEQAYKNSLFTGRYPSCVLYLTTNPANVDVNVHPAKTEVRFLREKPAFDAVYYAALGALQKESAPLGIRFSPSTEILKESAVSKGPEPVRRPAPPAAESFRQVGSDPSQRADADVPVRDANRVSYQTSLRFPSPSAVPTEDRASDIPSAAEIPSAAPKPEPREPEAPQVSEWRMVGEAMDTYLIVEQGSSLILIDKHAAHERILFDRLKTTGYRPMSQVLLAPIVCRVGAEDASLLEEHSPLLSEFGFEIDRFGDDSVVLRQIPSDLDETGAEALLEELGDDIRLSGGADPSAARDSVMHTVACKAAIKAGKCSDPRELRGLVEAVLSGQVKYCPHGRPVSMELTKAALDKSFRRS